MLHICDCYDVLLSGQSGYSKYICKIIHLDFKFNPPLLIDAGQFEGNSCVVWANTATQKIRTSDAWDTMVALKDVLVLAEMKYFDLCRVNEWLFHGTLTLQSMDTFTS